MPQDRPNVREGEEMWETTTNGRVWVVVSDHRGVEKEVSVGGKAGSRLRIKTLDREILMDRLPYGKETAFTNGLLKRIDQDQNLDERTATDQAFRTDELVALFAKSGNAFQAAVKKLNAINVGRMIDMAEAVDASASQISFLQQWYDENFKPKDGPTTTHKEMMGEAE